MNRLLHPRGGKLHTGALVLALALTLLGVAGSLMTRGQTRLPYADVQLAAARRMADAEQAVLAYIQEHDIAIEPDDINQTGLIGPEWTELTTSLGLLEAKRTSLQPDFAALLVKYYHEAGLKAGDTVCCGMSGSFPGLCIAAVAAANAMGLEVKAITSYGSSMYGGTRPALSTVRMLAIAQDAEILRFQLVAVSPGGDDDGGESVLFPQSRGTILRLAAEEGVPVIDEPDMEKNIALRLQLFGQDVDCFVNIGGATANMGMGADSVSFPNGLVLDPPHIPVNPERGLIFEYAARGIPVIHLLNVRGLAQDNGIPFDPVPLTQPGDTDVYYETHASPLPAAIALPLVAGVLWLGRRTIKSARKTAFRDGQGHGYTGKT